MTIMFFYKQFADDKNIPVPGSRVFLVLCSTLLLFLLYSGRPVQSVKLSPDYKYAFQETFEELNFNSKDGGLINSLLFKSDSSRGVICFWKGNGGNLRNWGLAAPLFLRQNYDVIHSLISTDSRSGQIWTCEM